LKFFIDVLLEAFRLIFSLDPEIYFVVWTSLKVAASATVFSSLLGVPIGLVIALNQFRGKPVILLILNSLMALPTVVIGLLGYFLLTRHGVLGSLGLLYTPTGITLGLFVLALPTIINLTLSAVQNLDRRLFLTCKLLGATPGQQGWMILKEGRFAVMAAIVVAFGRVISEVGIAMMLGGNIRGFTRTMTTAIALETGKGEFELGLALGIFLMIAAFGVNAVLFLLQGSRG
jgi:tungstate transport system permease protein